MGCSPFFWLNDSFRAQASLVCPARATGKKTWRLLVLNYLVVG